jgi:hypothetical protein
MLRHRTPKHPKRLFAGDSPLLRKKFAREFQLSGGPAEVTCVPESYREWLLNHGIEPENGHMTEAGLAFFKVCVEDTELTRSRKRGEVPDVRHRLKR